MKQEYMYAVVLCKDNSCAKVHVLALELEQTDNKFVFTDFLQMIETLRENNRDHILVIGMVQNKEWLDTVETTLYYCGFDCCDADGFPE